MKHEAKQCPRCATEFECKCGSVLLCDCSQVELSEDMQEQIAQHYDDCLCSACLKNLSQQQTLSTPSLEQRVKETA